MGELMRRYLIRDRGGREVEAIVKAISSEKVQVSVGPKTFEVGLLGNGFFRLPSGRVVAPITLVGQRGDIEVVWLDKRFEVRRALGEGTGRAVQKGEGPRKVQAQMPGRIVKVLVKAGEKVRTGQGLLVLEAMKMENEVRAPADGIVKRVFVKDGDRVETRADLVEIE